MKPTDLRAAHDAIAEFIREDEVDQPPGYPPASDSILGLRVQRFPRWWRRGVTRECWLIGRYAFKFPSLYGWSNFLQGLLANMQEIDLSGHHEFLCPVKWYIPGGWLVVMPRCKALDLDDWIYVEGQGYDYWFRPPGNVLPGEFKVNSFGISPETGEFVIIDYGN